MTVARIEEIFIYTYPLSDRLETYILYNQLDNLGIPYSKLEYNDVAQHPELFNALNTWWQPDNNGNVQDPLSNFPFAIYTEVHSDKTISYLPRKYIAGKDAIISELPALYALGR